MLIESNGMKASWAHRTGENEKKDNDKIKKKKVGPNVERLCTINDENRFLNFFQLSAIALKKPRQNSDCFRKRLHVFLTSIERQNDVTPSNAITDVTFYHFSGVNADKNALLKGHMINRVLHSWSFHFRRLVW